jgi:hypothetical protein
MIRLATRLPDFADTYDGRKQRALIQQLEQLFLRIKVDTTLPAYTVAGDYTIGVGDDVVLIDTSAGNTTATLPEISESMVQEKYEVEIVKATAENELTIVPQGTDTILGDTDVLVEEQWTALHLRATTGNWILL